MLRTDPEDRPVSVREVVDTLREVRSDAARASWEPISSEPVLSTRLGTSATRLMTTIVGIGFAKGSARERALEHLRQRGADAVPPDRTPSSPTSWARRATGTEASAALISAESCHGRGHASESPAAVRG